jgi:hypothetical protein
LQAESLSRMALRATKGDENPRGAGSGNQIIPPAPGVFA